MQRTPFPEAGEVHLWTFTLRPAANDRALLAPDEMQRAGAFHFTRDRNRFVAGRASLRRILAGYLGQHAASLRFSYGAAGKPVLDGAPAFNLSHSGDWAALAVAPFAVGVDIEQIRPVEDDLAGRFFAADEVALLHALPAEQQEAAFFAIWTRKEAYVKALGDGLTVPLDSFAVSLGEPPRLLRGAAPDQWQFHQFSPAPGFAGAIAAKQQGWQVIEQN